MPHVVCTCDTCVCVCLSVCICVCVCVCVSFMYVTVGMLTSCRMWSSHVTRVFACVCLCVCLLVVVQMCACVFAFCAEEIARSLSITSYFKSALSCDVSRFVHTSSQHGILPTHPDLSDHCPWLATCIPAQVLLIVLPFSLDSC